MKRLESELDNKAWITTQWKKTPLAWTCDTNGSPAYTSTGIALGGSVVQEGSRSSACKLEEHHQQGLDKDGNQLGVSRGGSSKQDQNGVKVWPNASTWTRVESRSKISSKPGDTITWIDLLVRSCAVGVDDRLKHLRELVSLMESWWHVIAAQSRHYRFHVRVTAVLFLKIATNRLAVHDHKTHSMQK